MLSGSATWQLERRRGDDLVTQMHLLRCGTSTLAQPGDRDRYEWEPQRGGRHAYLHFNIDDPAGLPTGANEPTARTTTESDVLEGLTVHLAVLLQRSNESIAGASTVTGFANPHHFSRRFARTYGSPPGAVRTIPEPPDPLGRV